MCLLFTGWGASDTKKASVNSRILSVKFNQDHAELVPLSSCLMSQASVAPKAVLHCAGKLCVIWTKHSVIVYRRCIHPRTRLIVNSLWENKQHGLSKSPSYRNAEERENSDV